MDSTIWNPFECECYIVTWGDWGGVREAPAHPEWSQGNRGTPGHKWGLDQVFMSPLRPLNRWLNITCHVSIMDKKIWPMKWLFCSLSNNSRCRRLSTKRPGLEKTLDQLGMLKWREMPGGGGGSWSWRGWRPGWQPPITRSHGAPGQWSEGFLLKWVFRSAQSDLYKLKKCLQAKNLKFKNKHLK